MASVLPIITGKSQFFIPTATSLDFVWTAADVTGNTFVCTGKELLLMNNTGAAPYTVTIASQPDIKGRSGDIVYTVGVGLFSHWTGGMTTEQGWVNETTRIITVTASNIAVKFAVLRLPY
jgi:hypothetical protein